MESPKRFSRKPLVAMVAVIAVAIVVMAVYLLLPPSNERLVNRLISADDSLSRAKIAGQLIERRDTAIAKMLVSEAKKERKAKAAQNAYRDRLISLLANAGQSPGTAPAPNSTPAPQSVPRDEDQTPKEEAANKKFALRSLTVIADDKSAGAVMDLVEAEKDKSIRSAGVTALKQMDNDKALMRVIKLYLATDASFPPPATNFPPSRPGFPDTGPPGSSHEAPSFNEIMDFKMELKDVIFDRPKVSAEGLAALRIGDSLRDEDSNGNTGDAPEIAGLLIELDKDAVPILTELVGEPTGNSQQWVPRIVNQIGKPAVNPLLELYERDGIDAPTKLRVLDILSGMKKQDRTGTEKTLSASVPFLISQLGEDYDFSLDVPIASNILGRIGAPALKPLLKALTKEETKQEAMDALSVMKNFHPEAMKPIDDAVKRKDYKFIAKYYVLYIRMGRPGSESALAQALYRHGDKEMAVDYLNTGNEKLEKAARTWARRNGYVVFGTPQGSGGPSWGQ